MEKYIPRLINSVWNCVMEREEKSWGGGVFSCFYLLFFFAEAGRGRGSGRE